ncbi:GNS1/SUR4 family domain-containing protein, putative [Eimeria tenella]|uniref:Elongation of fatty acids protein n=1 Tax=Eimeria tenella TaxID=5802 RepID=U6KTB7_EIMTE|nr:GNS1/SUR4 family domain-containing protein, putative [Eimeria tenella]CDJ38745.1 GNS1/SUR4 family domain-containing protein, putative [Eimeria tenella]|eukprot:XP_013229501.1 GNS1/SUR4 family domain-containing protein, putative [Eimeria tenella]
MTAAGKSGGASGSSALTAAAAAAAVAAVVCAVSYRPLCRLLGLLFPEELWGPGAGRAWAARLKPHIILTCLLYLPAVYLLRRFMAGRPPLLLRRFAFFWNLCLSVLSFVGFLTVVVQQPALLAVSVHPERLFKPPVRVVVALFTLTKAVEFGDTFILVFKKKPLSFLHLYHHLSVTLYCWSAQQTNVGFAHGFVVMNLAVHALMYLYYCMTCCLPSRSSSSSSSSGGSRQAQPAGKLAAAAGSGKGGAVAPATPSSSGTPSSSSSSSGKSVLQQVLRQARPAITLMQIAQMLVGMYLAANGALRLSDPEQILNAQIALAMYTSYAVLFLRLYCSSYLPHLSSNRVLLLLLLHFLAAAGLYQLACSPAKATLVAHVAAAAALSLLLASLCSSSKHGKSSSKDTNSSSSSRWLPLLLAFSFPCGLAMAVKKQQDEAAASDAAAAATAAATPAAAQSPERSASAAADAATVASSSSSSDGALSSSSCSAAAAAAGKPAAAAQGPQGKGLIRQLTHKKATISLTWLQLAAAAAGAAAPAVYGHLVFGHWGVGLCVFGGLRWALELHLSQHARFM